MSCKRMMIALVMLAPLCSCTTGNSPIGSTDPYLGEAVKYNAAVQTINPDPVYGPDAAKPGDSGVHGSEAVERYRTDKVKPVEKVMTSESTTGSGSGASPQQ